MAASAAVKVVACLGNPGAEYSTTRHNVGWWLADRMAEAWGLGRFRSTGSAAEAGGPVDGVEIRVLKPMTFMNRSGQALAPLLRSGLLADPAADLLVVVDDVALEPGRARFRATGSAGGHNGLKSVEATLESRDYARLRIGVGAKPPGVDLADWVLSSPPREERLLILGLLPELVDCVGVWAQQGIESAMNRCNARGRESSEDED